MAKVKDIAMQIRGVSYHPEDLHDNLDEDSVVLLRANNIKDGKLILDDVVYVSKSKVAEQQYLQTGDILICASSGSKELVGKAAFVDSVKNPMTFGAFCKVVRPQPEYSEYLGHYFNSPVYRRKISALSAGANINNIKNEHIDNLDIQLVDEKERRKIITILNELNMLISLRKQQLFKLDELIKARFVEMFGDAKLNPNNLPCCSLSEYIVFLTSGSRGWSQYFTDSGEYFITIKNVKNCKITLQDVQYVTPPDNAEAKRTRVQENDLLISITADLGRTGIVPKEIAEHGAYINQHLTCIRLKQDKLNPLYVAYYMESDAGKEQFVAKNQSAVKAGLNFNAINSLKLMVPPLALQNQFAAFVERVDQQKQTVQQSLEKLELMKKALMQEYFG